MTRPAAVAIALFTAVLCGFLPAQVPATKQPNPNITPVGPQRPEPPAARQPTKPGGQAPAPTNISVNAGTIYGFVYWDSTATAHLGPSICNALSITVAVASKSPYSPFGAIGTQSNFTSLTTVHPPLTSVSTTSYDGCAYSYSHAPLGQDLYVKVNLTQTVGTLTPATVAQDATVGPIQFSSAPCSKLPPLTRATVGELLGNWGSCLNVAYDVNFPLVQTAQLKPMSAGDGAGANQNGTPGALVQINSAPQNTPALAGPGQHQKMMLSQTRSNGTLLNNQSSASSLTNGMLLHSVTPSPTATAPSNSQPGTPGQQMPSKPGGGGNVELNPQPYPPKAGIAALSGGLRTSTDPESPSGSMPVLSPALSGGLKVVSGKRVRNSLAATSSLVAVLRQQKQESVPPLQTLASRPQPNLAAMPSDARLTAVSAPYVSSNLLTPKQNAWCKQSEAQGGAPAIFSVTGKLQGKGVVYSPDLQANPYTIVGCGFGNSSGTVQLDLESQPYQSGWSSYPASTVYTVNFTIQSWNDHVIVVSILPDTSGVPDWSSVALHVKTRLTGDAAGGMFVAARQTVLLANIPQKQTLLYQTGSPYFLSPVSNYYGLNGTAAVMREGLAGPVGGQDQFSLKLSPGFVVDSTQTDLLVANTASNVSSQPATVIGNTITVTYPVLEAGSGNSTNYYSIYGLKVWVTGPAGLAPLAP